MTAPAVETSAGPKVQAAFFDVDGTLVKGDTQEMEACLLLSGKWRSPGYLGSLAVSLGALWLNKLGKISVSRQNEAYLRSYLGMTRAELECVGQTLFNRRVRSRLFPRALETLAAHRAAGHLIVLVSATTRHLLSPLKDLIRPDFILCTDLEFDRDGKASGRPLDGICAEEKKKEKIRSLALDQGLDLSACHAYSDHHSDLPLLATVGHAHAVNPTPGLLATARDRGWPVHRF